MSKCTPLVKGDALERHIATPAWRPLLSLESVDGQGLTLVEFSAEPEPFLVIDPAHRNSVSHKWCLH